MRTRRFPFFLLFPLLVLGACGPRDLSHLPAPGSTVILAQPENRPAAAERSALVRRAIRQHLAAENFRAALALVRQEVPTALPEAALAEEYEQALNGVLTLAEKYRQRGVPEKAGPLYRAALEAYPETPRVAKRVTLASTEISALIASCAAQLMDRGLAAYRSGDLDLAITTWQTIHTFDPRHQPSQRALQTAEVQRSNLEKMAGKK